MRARAWIVSFGLGAGLVGLALWWAGTQASAGPAPAESQSQPLQSQPAAQSQSQSQSQPQLDDRLLARAPANERQRGVALGLFAEDVSFDYGPLLAEIAALGATHVSLIVPLYQEHAASTSLRLHTRLSPSLAATAEAIRAARRAGLEVTLFPIVRLAAPRTPNEWRGTLAPADVDAWFASYGEQLGDLAALATMTGVSRLVVGSELSSLDAADADLARWKALIARMRALFPGTLVYSANWDHYREAKLFDLVDEAGVVGYFGLREAGGAGDVEALLQRWRALALELSAWAAARKQPFLFTEVGYRSRAGATATPWDEGSGGVADAEEQRRGFEAFRRAWSAPTPGGPGFKFAGAYVWNWYGFGGAGTTGYTPRGKPAAEEVRRLLQEL
jgi:hypothetical protein